MIIKVIFIIAVIVGISFLLALYRPRNSGNTEEDDWDDAEFVRTWRNLNHRHEHD